MNRILAWLQQPTTLQGLACLLGAAVGSRMGLNAAEMSALASAAIPLLMPERSTAQQAAAVAAAAFVTQIGQSATRQIDPVSPTDNQKGTSK